MKKLISLEDLQDQSALGTLKEEDIERFVKKWTLTGLLQNLDFNQETILAYLLEMVSQEMKADKSRGKPAIVNTIFPIIRLLADKEIYPEPKWFYADFSDWFSEQKYALNYNSALHDETIITEYLATGRNKARGF